MRNSNLNHYLLYKKLLPLLLLFSGGKSLKNYFVTSLALFRKSCNAYGLLVSLLVISELEAKILLLSAHQNLMILFGKILKYH